MHDLGTLEPTTGQRSPTSALVALAAALLVAALLQSTVAARLPTTLPRPDIVLLIALAWGFLRGSGEGVLASIVGGLLLDLTSSGPFGLHALIFAVATLLVTNDRGPFFADPVRRSLGAAAAAALVHVFTLTAVQLRGWDVWWSAVAFRSILPAVVVDAALLPVCYALLRTLPKSRSDVLVGGM
jgi:rod shape-determining protein MreD